jgi:hypothetical protein
MDKLTSCKFGTEQKSNVGWNVTHRKNVRANKRKRKKSRRKTHTVMTHEERVSGRRY